MIPQDLKIFLISVTAVAFIIFLGVMYWKWDAKRATTYQDRKKKKF